MPRYPMPDEQVPSAHEAYRQRLQRLERRSGGGGSAVSFTPTLYTSATAGGSISLGNGLLNGFYVVNGGMAFVRVELKWGSTTTITGSNAMGFTLPSSLTPAYPAGWDLRVAGSAYFWDQSAGASSRAGIPWLSSTGGAWRIFMYAAGSNTYVYRINPFTWAAGDYIWADAHYPI